MQKKIVCYTPELNIYNLSIHAATCNQLVVSRLLWVEMAVFHLHLVT